MKSINLQDYELIIFDWDGTLMDSVARIVSCMQSAAKNTGLVIPEAEQVKNIVGLSLPKAMNILFPSCDKQQAEAVIAQYKHQYIAEDNTPTPLFENAITLLAYLRDKNKLLAVATGKGRNGLERVWGISETKHFFHTSRCADEALSKPDPEMLLSILSELSVPAEKAIMIGDTSYDLEMARNASVASIGVTYGVHDKDVLALYQPKVIVDSLAELQALFST